MKLKKLLISAFLILTLIPTVIMSVSLYKSSLSLSKGAYMRNLTESVNVQVDYIVQTIENNMISDYRFVKKNYVDYDAGNPDNADASLSASNEKVIDSFHSYLEMSEDKVTVCILLDKNNVPIYSIGEKTLLDKVQDQLPDFSQDMQLSQRIMEFNLENNTHSLGIVTPVLDGDEYLGCFVSVYNKSYIFKILSSYYKVSDSSTYICRQDGQIVNFIKGSDDKYNTAVEGVISQLSFETSDVVDTRMDGQHISGYYKNIHNTPWYLVGFIDYNLIYQFASEFILFYAVVIIAILILDVILSFYFSNRVVEPINRLISLMSNYKDNLDFDHMEDETHRGYFETCYLREKFLELMSTITLVQHNFTGIYQLYQSSAMDDTNIDIDVVKQTAYSNKPAFQELMDSFDMASDKCIVERFTQCFCEKDRVVLMDMFTGMRDQHLSVTRETEVYTPNFNQKWFHTLVVPMYNGTRLSRLFIQLRDISNFKKHEFESSEKAMRDPLTGIYNRSGFYSCVEKSLISCPVNKDLQYCRHALLFIDMNYFKMVNDNLGHSTGDELLRSIADILQDTVSVSGITSRFGGDEFAVFLPNTDDSHTEGIISALRERLVFPFKTDSISFEVSASIGVAFCNGELKKNIDELIKQADSSMYEVKREFKKMDVASVV